MPDRIARVWSGSSWEPITSPATAPNAIVYYQSSAPSPAAIGQLWFDSSNNVLKAYNGSSWVSTSVDLSSYATISYVSNAENIPALNSTKVPTVSINTQAGTSYSLSLSDAGKLVYMTSGVSASVSVPLESSVNFPTGTRIDIVQAGTGAITISPVSGVTINSDGNKRQILAQWCGASLIKTATNTWLLLGALRI